MTTIEKTRFKLSANLATAFKDLNKLFLYRRELTNRVATLLKRPNPTSSERLPFASRAEFVEVCLREPVKTYHTLANIGVGFSSERTNKNGNLSSLAALGSVCQSIYSEYSKR